MVSIRTIGGLRAYPGRGWSGPGPFCFTVISRVEIISALFRYDCVDNLGLVKVFVIGSEPDGNCFRFLSGGLRCGDRSHKCQSSRDGRIIFHSRLTRGELLERRWYRHCKMGSVALKYVIRVFASSITCQTWIWCWRKDSAVQTCIGMQDTILARRIVLEARVSKRPLGLISGIL